MNIEQELQKVTKVKPHSGEDRQDYLRRMVAGLPINEAWDELPLEVQSWANKMIQADNADKDIPDFPETASDSNGEKDKSDMELNSKESPTKKKTAAKPPGKKVAAKPPAKGKAEKPPAKGKAPAKAVKEPPVRAPRAAREDGVKYRIKKMLVEDPNISPEDIANRLKKDGDKPSKFTVQAIRAEFRHTMQVMRDLGWPKVKI